MFAFRKEKKNLVSYSSWMKDGYIPGEAICEADCLSRYCATTVIAPLLPNSGGASVERRVRSYNLVYSCCMFFPFLF